MIACLRGELFEKSGEKLIILTGGVGYEIFATASCLQALPEKGEQVFIHVYTHVREDALILYGFADITEKSMFHQLITVSGIGPRLALTILSGISAADLSSAIRNESIARLTKLSGVGKKTAERLCLELKDKMKMLPEQGASQGRTSIASQDTLWVDSVSALVNLGYPGNNAEEAVRRVMAEEENKASLALEKIVIQALRLLA